MCYIIKTNSDQVYKEAIVLCFCSSVSRLHLAECRPADRIVCFMRSISMCCRIIDQYFVHSSRVVNRKIAEEMGGGDAAAERVKPGCSFLPEELELPGPKLKFGT